MPLMRLGAIVILALAVCSGAAAQSLSPMRHGGTTPSAVKGFRLTVGNPYRQRMVFQLIPMNPGFSDVAEDASVTPGELVLAPGFARQVILAFRIPAGMKERTIGLCVQPRDITGPVLPRVCGTYTGTRLPGAGG